MTAKDILNKVKAVFNAPVQAAAPAMPEMPEAVSTVVSYNVDGGQPVYVDISDDGMPDIDAGDPVYADEAKTTPYPDGDYKLTGTDFGFTVAGGVVSAVSDPDGKGAGAPNGDASAAPDPVTTDVPPAPTFEERLKMLEDAVAQLITASKTPTQYATEVQLQEANKKIEKQDKVIEGLFELAEKLTETPTAEPKTLVGNKKQQFERTLTKEKRIEGIGNAISQLKNNK